MFIQSPLLCLSKCGKNGSRAGVPRATMLVACGVLAGLIFAAPQIASAGEEGATWNRGGVGQLLIRADSAHLERLELDYGVNVLRRLSTSNGEIQLIEGPDGLSADQTAELLAGDSAVHTLEPALLASLFNGDGSPDPAPLANEVNANLLLSGTSANRCLGAAMMGEVWSGYGEQGAIALTRLEVAQAAISDCGAATVAVIDTGVDPRHPALEGVLVPGFDFLEQKFGVASEWNGLHQSVRAIVEQSVRAIVEQSVRAIVEGYGVAELESPIAPILSADVTSQGAADALPPFFGHGTMVAGLVHLAAPGARIMPLRVFDAEGTAHVFDIVEAIYYAVDHGADIINMSFSVHSPSPELHRAIQYAQKNGVVCVAAVGNHGSRSMVYPAAYGQVLGIASTTLDDELSEFSAFGSGLVDLAAPGSGVVSLFPGGGYAAGWGTSFSAPFVSGALALLHSRDQGDRSEGAVKQRQTAVERGATFLPGLEGQVGSGRLDAYNALFVPIDSP